MSAHRPPRTRSSSEVAQERPAPQPRRPSLQNRSYSAPAWDLYPSHRPKGHDLGGPVIEESEMPPAGPDARGDVHGSNGSPTEAATPKPRLPQVNLAIVGAQGVGKSTFVQRALDLKQPPISRSSMKKMSLDGTIYLVRLLEIASHKITFDENGCIVWPKFIGEQELPIIDGVLVLFDSFDPRSVAQFPRIFSALPKSTIPFIVVACRCEGQVPTSQVDPVAFEQARRVLGGIEVHQTYSDVPDSQKKCISNILRAIIARTADSANPRHSPKSANRAATSSRAPRRPIPPPTRQHTRANSENPSSTHHPSSQTRNTITDSNVASNVAGSRNVRSNSQPMPPRTPPGSRLNRGESLGNNALLEEVVAKAPYQRLRTSWRHSGGSDAFSSFLDMEDEGDDSRGSGPPSTPDTGKDRPTDQGSAFDELVDRLLSPPMSKQDAKFSSIFLCLYRKFATPAKLLSTLLLRFEKIGSGPTAMLTRHADHLRLLNVMSQWVSEYPGDFAGPKTRKRLTDFIASLEKQFVFAFAAKEMNSFLEREVEDDDLGWAYEDDSNESENVETFLDTSVQSSPATFVAQSSENSSTMNVSSLDLSDENQDLSSQFSNLSTTSSVYRSGSISSQSFLTLLSVESAQQEAQRLELSPRTSLTKDQWKQFMSISEEEFAREVTRIDWVMFSSFRPRELVRHVSVSTEDRASSKGLANVNRMIDEFNHLALFVASVVLFRDKPKHRAQALEKFMNIAMKLRQFNNYNSLGAVIAGLNGTPVYRLTQTRELVSPVIQKQFMSLVILMGTQKSHFAYRLAWENSFAEKIPFLPLHRRDLVSAEEGNKTFIGPNNDRINWRKFEIMGEVVLGIHNSQRTPFPCYPKNEDVRRLILETKFPADQDELYNRSMQVEPSSGSEPARKLFGFRRT
ncbi:hypothetical protein FQN51_002256 [Onygenales sp. PD_10]|nr:hypothetical protein FQN51_002256 [Onygenales sp. PD_10]